MLAARSPRGLCYLGVERGLRELERWAARHAPRAKLVRSSRALGPVIRQLREYAARRRTRFDLPLDLRGTAFQLRVWRVLLGLGYGATASYAEIARRIGQPRAYRAVGQANGANSVPVLVPCHRCLAKNGLGGFGLGLPLKRRLLELEGART